MGIQVPETEILTPPVAALAWLREREIRDLALFVPEATRAEFSGIALLPEDRESGAGAVILGDLGAGWDFATLNRAFRLLMAKPRPHLIALGMTRYWRAPDGLRLDCAPFVMALQHATGVDPVVLGKPAAPFFETALAAIGAKAEETLMIGDDIRGDVGGAQQADIRGLLVRTGKFQHGVFAPNSRDRAAATPGKRGKGAKPKAFEEEQEKTTAERRAAMSSKRSG